MGCFHSRPTSLSHTRDPPCYTTRNRFSFLRRSAEVAVIRARSPDSTRGCLSVRLTLSRGPRTSGAGPVDLPGLDAGGSSASHMSLALRTTRQQPQRLGTLSSMRRNLVHDYDVFSALALVWGLYRAAFADAVPDEGVGAGFLLDAPRRLPGTTVQRSGVEKRG